MKRYLLVFLPLFAFFGRSAAAQCGSESISRAQEHYDLGRQQECIAGLSNCLADEKGFNYNEKLDAYRLLAMAYLAMDSVAQADKAIGDLIVLKDNFDADSRDPMRFKLRVLFMRLQMRSNQISSVSKKAERIELAPATIQIITATDIVNRGYVDLESIFSDLPGFDVSRTNGLSYSTLYQRGYRSSALTDRTLVLVDGVEDNELWTNAAYLSKQYPVSSVKRVEIIYGPASTIYGANAFQGVINIVLKKEEDFFAQKADEPTKKTGIALSAQSGIGSYKTRYYDASLAAKNEKLFFSVTGRLYQSDEYDLSAYPNWDGKIHFDKAVYARLLKQGSTPTPAYLIQKASYLDSTAYYRLAAANGANRYQNRTRDFYLNAQLSLSDIKLRLQYWNISEGTASDYLDNYVAINEMANWQVKQYFFTARYDKQVFNKLYVSSISYFKTSQFGPAASSTRFRSYGNGDLSYKDLLVDSIPSFRPNYYATQTNQFRTELTGNYTINQFLDVTAGTELRNGIQQGDYVQGPKYPAIRYGTVAGSTPGGNNYTSFTFGLYAQLNYQNKGKHLNLNAGGRFDNNQFRQNQGYGSVFNSRFAVVYYPKSYVFKAIYSEAFLDASSFNKFSTSATRRLNNPNLEPERVRNLELSARYTYHQHTSIEVAAYAAYYNSILQTASVAWLGGTTSQFQALYKVQVHGIQITGQTALNKHVDVYANFTATDPKEIISKDSVVRLGDISRFTLNAGVNVQLLRNRLNINGRTNVVGSKPTGKNTSVSQNPLSQINGYQLFNVTATLKMTKAVWLQLICNNAFNQFYESPGIRAADNVQYAASVPQPSRNYGAKLIVNFNNQQ